MGLTTQKETIDTAANAAENPCPAPALTKAMGRLLQPLARLCLAHGVAFAEVEESLKQAFVREADALQPEAPQHGKVSRISTATGLTRREVTRLLGSETSVRPSKPPVATELFAGWTTDSQYQTAAGEPAVLKRLGPAPSFEALARSVTRDIHPRSMLDELVRLGMVLFNEELDSVSLVNREFVPRRDAGQMLDLLSDNVGDHLDAAVSNVLQDGRSHLEQAVFADELSAESVKALHPYYLAHWTSLRNEMVPVITALIDEDRRAGRPQDKRVRIGLYTFEGTMGSGSTPGDKPARVPRRKYSGKETKK